jgi:hypothetical protein
MKIIDEETKRVVKEQAFTKYAEIIKIMISKDHYSDFNNILSSMLALEMASEVVKKNLVDMGADSAVLEKAAKVAKEEILILMDMNQKGTLQKLMAQEK